MRKLCILLLSLAPIVTAQTDRPFTFHVGGGGTFPVNRLSDYTDTGYNIKVGGGWRVVPALELLGEFDIHGLEVKDSVLNNLAVPDGTATIYSVTGNVKWNFAPRARVNPYAIIGGGWYRRTVEFTEPTTRIIDVIDPWWGYLGPAIVPSNRVLGSITRDSGGLNGGAGIDIRVAEGVRIFIESRIHRAYHNPTNTTLVPITAGLRF